MLTGITNKFRNYASVVRYVLENGDVTTSRVGPMTGNEVGRTLEIRGLSFMFTPGDAVWRPGYSNRLAWTEALHVLGGSFDATHFAAVSPKSASMFTAQMAYGPRVQPHMATVATELMTNPHTRRALVYVGHNYDSILPCTNSFQWLVRNGRLETYISMRSWDLILGLPYDIFMFGALTLALSGATGIPVGPAEVHAASAHIYEKHWRVEPSKFENHPGTFDLFARGWTHNPGKTKQEVYWDSLRKFTENALRGCPWAEESWLATGPGVLKLMPSTMP